MINSSFASSQQPRQTDETLRRVSKACLRSLIRQCKYNAIHASSFTAYNFDIISFVVSDGPREQSAKAAISIWHIEDDK